MDPLTQGALGAALPMAVAKRRQIGAALLVGAVAGMAADLDVLIRSTRDPLLFLEYHRQFTHSLFFIPFGALACAALCHGLARRRLQLGFALTYLFALLGYATHALLDACTSYGTLLLWPFSQQRFAWDTVSVIDPLVTLPLLGLVFLAARRRTAGLAALAVAWVMFYQLLGYAQQQRALAMGWQLAAARTHTPVHITAKPTIANILLWRTIYRHEGRFYSDGVRAGWRVQAYPGSSIAVLDTARDYPWLAGGSQQARDITRFERFSQGYTGVDEADPLRIIDMRYAMLPTEVDGLWGIEINPQRPPAEHAEYVTKRNVSAATRQRFWRMLRGLELTPDGLSGAENATPHTKFYSKRPI
nr:putative metal-dependent hydrolase [uncultured bacterium]